MSLLDHVVSVVLAAVLSATAGVVPASAPTGDLVVGRDVSWPNCPKGLGIASRPTQGKPMPPASARFVVVGLTNGPAFHPNPCLEEQVAFARLQHLWTGAYAVLTYPTRSQLVEYGGEGTLGQRLHRTGAAQAQQNVAAMAAVGLDSPIVWVDVEPVSSPAPWSLRPRANRAVLDGAVTAYRDAGLRVGFYSTPTMWRDIVGPVRYGFPEWRTAGLSSRAAALGRCGGPQFQGGRAVLAQWYSTRADFDLLCPGRPADALLSEFFSRL
ncbi:MAG: hypothetical protein ABIQ59_02000 [Nocardioidaceae bacterium]